MASSKLFVGRKIRELREAHHATQATFAERLGISTSYLNQIENNQRPVSASVLLALAEKFRINISELSQSDGDRLLSALTESLGDPVFHNTQIGHQELKLVAQNAPSVAKALIACHQAFRRSSEQVASLDDRLGQSATIGEPTPYEEVRDYFHFIDNYVHQLDVAAETLATELGIGDRDAQSALAGYIENRHGIRVAHASADDNVIRRYAAQDRVLYLNPYSPVATRNFQIAYEIARLEIEAEIATVASAARFRSEGAYEICQIGLRNYFAGALLLPYQQFSHTAKALRHDLELLAGRFGASIEQVAHRLSTLQRPGIKGVPVFFARIDRAGNITKRHSAAKLQFARFGAACPLWNVHQAFETPGRFLRQLAETPDGARYLCIATDVSKGGGGFNASLRRYAIALGCEVTYAADFVYSDGLELSNRVAYDAIGTSCRICDRPNCHQRAVPPLKSRLVIDPDRRDVLPYRIS